MQHKRRPDPVELASGGTAWLQGSSRRRLHSRWLLKLQCFNAASVVLLAGDEASMQHPWRCSPAKELQRNIHGAARRRQTCNATAMVLHRIIHGAARRRQSCNASAMVLQHSIHGAARRRRSFNAASMVLGRSCNRASIEHRCCVGARSELQATKLRRNRWSFIGAAMELGRSCNGVRRSVIAALELHPVAMELTGGR